MTELQLMALKRALASGYFDLPARVDTRRLAKASGMTRTTHEVHLCKSVKRLSDSLLPYIGMESTNEDMP